MRRGLGIRRTQDVNIALLAKQDWKSFKKSHKRSWG